jgi:hypothetical protein
MPKIGVFEKGTCVLFMMMMTAAITLYSLTNQLLPENSTVNALQGGSTAQRRVDALAARIWMARPRDKCKPWNEHNCWRDSGKRIISSILCKRALCHHYRYEGLRRMGIRSRHCSRTILLQHRNNNIHLLCSPCSMRHHRRCSTSILYNRRLLITSILHSLSRHPILHSRRPTCTSIRIRRHITGIHRRRRITRTCRTIITARHHRQCRISIRCLCTPPHRVRPHSRPTNTALTLVKLPGTRHRV